MFGKKVLFNYILKKFFFLSIFLTFSGCLDQKQSQIINNELKFYYKGQSNMFLEVDKKKIIKKFYEF